MYLRILDREEQKNFLELAYCAANYNQKFSDEQENLINEYRDEISLGREEYEIQEKELEDILNSFTDCSQKKKNAIFLEIMALILSDNIYDEKEREVIFIIANHLNIEEDQHDEAVGWVKDMQELYERSENFINT